MKKPYKPRLANRWDKPLPQIIYVCWSEDARDQLDGVPRDPKYWLSAPARRTMYGVYKLTDVEVLPPRDFGRKGGA